MGYYNPIYVYGVDRFLADAKAAGVDGLIVVDLPPEEDEELCLPALEGRAQLHPPRDADHRRQAPAGGARATRRASSTTSRSPASPARAAPDAGKVADAVARIKRHTALPVAVGFGVRTAEQARAIAARRRRRGGRLGAGRARSRTASTRDGKATAKTVTAVTDLVAELADGVRGARADKLAQPARG